MSCCPPLSPRQEKWTRRHVIVCTLWQEISRSQSAEKKHWCAGGIFRWCISRLIRGPDDDACRSPILLAAKGSIVSGLHFVSEDFFFKFIFFKTFINPLRENSGRLSWVWLHQPQERRDPVLRVSVIYRTLTWTTGTGSLTCGRDRSYAWVWTLGLGTANQYNILSNERKQVGEALRTL